MLSLIICSRTPRISEELEKNIAETIGCEYELVVIDNSKNKYSIFSAYNEGVRRSKGDILCFMHDDILYKTLAWGERVQKELEDVDIGCVGILGAYRLGKNSYWDMEIPYTVGCVIVSKDMRYKISHEYYNNGKNEVAVVDGMWFCIPKKLFSDISFDEKTFSGFHFYDMDICMQIQQEGKKVIVLKDCEINHYCNPQYEDAFFIDMERFTKKWEDKLPICISIKPDEVLCKANDNRNKAFKKLYHDYNTMRENYNSVIHSKAFLIGSFMLKPIYVIKGLLKNNNCD